MRLGTAFVLGLTALVLGCFKKTGGTSSTSKTDALGSAPGPSSTNATAAGLPNAADMGLLRAEIQMLKEKMEKSDTELAGELRAQLQLQRDQFQADLKKTQEQLDQESKTRQELEKKLAEVDARLTKADSDLAAQLRSEIAAKAQELAKQVAQLNDQLTALQTQVNAIPDIYATKVELRDQVMMAVKSLQDLLNTRVGQLETQMSQQIKQLQTDTLIRFAQIDVRQATLATDIQSLSAQLLQLALQMTQKLTEVSMKADKAATDAQTALTKLTALELDGKNLVNEVGALLSTIQGDITTAQAGGTTSTGSAGGTGTGLSQTAQALNLLLSGFTKEAAGLVVFSYKVEEALKSRFDILQQNYTQLVARMAGAEQKTAQVQTQLDGTQAQLSELQNAFLMYQSNQAAVQKKLMDDVGVLTAQLQTLQNKVDALPNPPTAPEAPANGG